MFFKKLCILALISTAFLCEAQILRFDPTESSIGIQTPHEWHIYAHTKGRVAPLFPTVNTWSSTTQVGYVWYLGDRGGMRTGAQITYWGLFQDLYYYYEIIPLGIALYPFNRDYLGIDLELSIPPQFFQTRINAVFLVRF